MGVLEDSSAKDSTLGSSSSMSRLVWIKNDTMDAI